LTGDETQPLPVMDDEALEAAARAEEAQAAGAAPEFNFQPSEAGAVQQLEEPSIASVPAPSSYYPAGDTDQRDAAQTLTTGVTRDDIVARVEEEVPTAEAVVQQAAAGATEHDTIAQAVHRVMERMKQNLVEEIVRELKKR
jgi:GTPase Era involved in 16S rRNA processing